LAKNRVKPPQNQDVEETMFATPTKKSTLRSVVPERPAKKKKTRREGDFVVLDGNSQLDDVFDDFTWLHDTDDGLSVYVANKSHNDLNHHAVCPNYDDVMAYEKWSGHCRTCLRRRAKLATAHVRLMWSTHK
jgi:hypothetical protein